MAGIQRISSKFPYLYQIDADQSSASDLSDDGDEVPPIRSISEPSHRTAAKRRKNSTRKAAVRTSVRIRHYYSNRVDFCTIIRKSSKKVSRFLTKVTKVCLYFEEDVDNETDPSSEKKKVR